MRNNPLTVHPVLIHTVLETRDVAVADGNLLSRIRCSAPFYARQVSGRAWATTSTGFYPLRPALGPVIVAPPPVNPKSDVNLSSKLSKFELQSEWDTIDM